MFKSSVRIGALALAATAIAGCTTTGIGTGQALNGKLNANFTWTQQGGTEGVMIAHLSDGTTYQGQFFQVTSESSVDSFGPLWAGWGGGWGGWGGWGWGSRWGWGWGGWGPWGPYDQTITYYSGQVLANLQGPSGHMRCHFTLQRPYSGMAGGGLGQCQLPNGVIIDAQFPRGSAQYH